MSERTLYDRSRSILGWIDTRSDGYQVGYNASRRIVGYYDPKMNKTYDAGRSFVGDGNQLAMLVSQSRE